MKPDRVFRILPSRSSPAVIFPGGSTVPAMRLLPRPGRGGQGRTVIIVRAQMRANHEPDRWLTARGLECSFSGGRRDRPPEEAALGGPSRAPRAGPPSGPRGAVV